MSGRWDSGSLGNKGQLKVRKGAVGESHKTISALCVVRYGLGIVLGVQRGVALTGLTNAVKKEQQEL